MLIWQPICMPALLLSACPTLESLDLCQKAGSFHNLSLGSAMLVSLVSTKLGVTLQAQARNFSLRACPCPIIPTWPLQVFFCYRSLSPSKNRFSHRSPPLFQLITSLLMCLLPSSMSWSLSLSIYPSSSLSPGSIDICQSFCHWSLRLRGRQTDRHRHRHRHRHRQTDRRTQTQTQTDRQTDREKREREREMETPQMV